ncbi:MAG: hypothetical protein HKP58_00965 [Desulfatitalea sp.]|nr:hypothetical protein [Desulfatitalea sp.]NNJ98956.1 hypothetical protein [Desulfatitalea sp.]
MQQPDTVSCRSHPWLVAHRGARDEAPENTRTAFERALSYAIDGIELDVQMSADRVPVVYHDETLMRICRRRDRVADLPLASLQQLDWGGWFHADFAGEPLPTLAQVLDRVASRTRLMIEIKSSPDLRRSGHVDRLVRQVVRLLPVVSPRLLPERIFLLSFDAQALRLAHSLAPEWNYVLNIVDQQADAFAAWPTLALDHLYAVCVRIGKLTHELTRWARGRGLRCFTYTCNGPRQVTKAQAMQVDAILTDRPKWLSNRLAR